MTTEEEYLDALNLQKNQKMKELKCGTQPLHYPFLGDVGEG